MATKSGSEEKTEATDELKVGDEKQENVEYVTVAETEESERIELPLLPEDNSLSINTLTHAFPGAHGLKYKNAVTGASRALLLVLFFASATFNNIFYAALCLTV
ncbi:unnamed protein product [Gongylonema pulchrum]|uniref:TDP43_N domain-containing protein n=1 Tax=Gongylonema pulchrum TaxID=637853 RepID=A0A183ECH2_9BILA|nr:unnamed protein product [Gongylonema pulchrum]